ALAVTLHSLFSLSISTATSVVYTLSLHDALPIYVLHDLKTLDFDPAVRGIGVVISGHSHKPGIERRGEVLYLNPGSAGPRRFSLDRKSTRLNSSHVKISYAVFCLKKKKIILLRIF